MARLKAVAAPIALAVVVGGAAVAFLASKELPPMALLHVVAMAAAFLVAAPLGAIVQKVRGNTSLHAKGMGAGALIRAPNPSRCPLHARTRAPPRCAVFHAHRPTDLWSVRCAV